MAKRIAIDDIRADGGTQTRAELRPDVIEDYAEAMRRGDEFPPIDLFLDKAGHYWLADGFHRFNGAASAELPDIAATIHKGELRDAIWFALSANSTNGLRRTNEDKRRCVTLALSDKQWSSKTDQALADHVGVDRSYVCKLRNELVTVTSSDDPPKRKGKDGKARPAKYKARKPSDNGKPKPEEPIEQPEAAGSGASTNASNVTRQPDASEPNDIGAIKDRIADFLNDIIADQPAHVRVVIADYLEELAKEIR